MYEYLKGIITKITAKYIVLETNGIGYILHVANPYAYSGQVNQETQIYVHQVVREDAHLLYGFRSEDEKKLFLSLISVSQYFLELVLSSKCKLRVKLSMSNQVPTLEKLKSLVQKEQRLFVFLIFPQLTKTRMIFLNASEHFFHI